MSGFTIGILGGMGPRATAYFEQKLLEQFQGPDQSVPRIIVVNDGNVPDRTAFLCGGGADPVPALEKSARLLMQARPDIVCMPCNTAHAAQILGRLQERVALPFIDMPAAVLDVAAGYERVLILGTEGTKGSGVYNQRASADTTIMYPNQARQAVINHLIADTKARGYTEANRNSLRRVIAAATADAVILACTELSMLNNDLRAAMPIIDALEVLAVQCATEHEHATYAITYR